MTRAAGIPDCEVRGADAETSEEVRREWKVSRGEDGSSAKGRGALSLTLALRPLASFPFLILLCCLLRFSPRQCAPRARSPASCPGMASPRSA
eukprot:2719416-Rhodomonas_salina.13